MINNIADLQKIKDEYIAKMSKYEHLAMVCFGTGCVSANCESVRTALVEELEKRGMTDKVAVIERGCMGTCAVGPVVYVLPDETYYTEMTADKIREVVEKHFVGGEPVEEYTFYDTIKRKHMTNIHEVSFFKDQVRIALRNCGLVDVNCINSYISKDGYMALAKCLEKGDRMAVIDELKKSGLRGRGGGGFPTGVKWEAGYKAPAGDKYIICNADEGDPGAFMDRSVFEGDPHCVIEGMLIGGYAIGAEHGVVYIRAEYPIAIRRLEAAMQMAKENGLLGQNIMGSGFNFDLEIRIGAGAFVCGEETALMSSVEGQRGEPRQKPPFPFQKGLFQKPTIINNVETFANVPQILLRGSDWFRQYGTPESPGTKVFAVTGNIVNSGLVEVPMGMPLSEVVYSIGGGIPDGKKFKSAQTGGPSGGCITINNINTPLEYNSLIALGSMIGSGGLIIMDEDTCMVDTARFYMDFIQEESCGKCTACRVGTKRMLETLERITRGEGKDGDIELLEELALVVKDSAMCGLGQTAPNPILSTIKYFREEYEEHIYQKSCRAGVCADLYTSPCQNACPADINIPAYMAKIATGSFVDAYKVMFEENPFPGICGRICTHPCESRCRRGTVDEALAICELKRFASDYAYSANEPKKIEVAPKNGKKVAVIGAGPSGLTCGYYLARLGYEVDAYEAEAVAGGILQWGIPEYRLPKKLVQHEIDIICKHGVNIIYNTKVGKDISFADLKAKYDAVYVANGAMVASKAGVEGEDLDGVYGGLDFLKRVALQNDLDFKGKKVAVIGGGNTAIDAARTALRIGADKVTILYRRTEDAMPAALEEIEDAIVEGVEIIDLVAPAKFVGENGKLTKIDCTKMGLKEFDSSGRRKARPIEGSNFDFEADVVIPAVSQAPNCDFLGGSEVGLTKWGSVVADKVTQATAEEGVFAGGDAYRGPEDVVHAIHDAKLAAAAIDQYLGGEGVLNKGEHLPVDDFHDQDEIVEHKRFPKETLPVEKRASTFDEVVLGYHKLNAVAEAMRCLRCDRR